MWQLIRLLLKHVEMIHSQIWSPPWTKTIYSGPAVRANGKARTKHHNWPRAGLVQRSSCFCSSHVSLVLSIHLTVSTREPGGKETPPRLLRKFIFSKQTQTSHRGSSGPTHTETAHSSSEGPRGSFYRSIYFGNLWIPPACSLYRLLTITWAEPNECIDAIT